MGKKRRKSESPVQVVEPSATREPSPPAPAPARTSPREPARSLTESIPDPVMPARDVLLLLLGILAFPAAVSLAVKYLVLPWLE